ncbi:MAG: acyl-CoA/acyl-ACP dehydrogenase [Deltaproteobacteria bacterium]|nr:acyl-CoA/acyl-ACP dehydrogenase [Deltaproteobacteria bacterium]
MNFGFTQEQQILRSEVRKYLEERCPMEDARRIMESAEGYCPERWKEIAELGWLGLLVPESYGGAGLGWVDLVVLLEETGRALFPSPLLGTVLATLAIVENGSPEQQQRYLPRIAEGTDLFSVAWLERADVLDPEVQATRAVREGDDLVLDGEKLFVTDAVSASHFIVSCRESEGPEGIALAVVPADAAGVTVTNLPSIDASKRLGKVSLAGVRVPADATLQGASGRPAGAAALGRLFDHAAAAITAEMVGAAEGAHAMVVEYAKVRRQFGSLIGRFQGVKHPLAEMYVDIESFKSLLYYAAWCLDEAPDEAAEHVSMAKAYASDAFTRIGIDAVELHGAIGYTWEYDAQLYLKRSKWAKAMFGSADHHYERVAELGVV